MSTALLIRERNPDENFVLHGSTPYFRERTNFYPTNSDITRTTRDLSQHEYRSHLYRDLLQDDPALRGSLRSLSRSLRHVSGDLRQSLQEESTAKSFLQSGRPSSTLEDVQSLKPADEGQRPWLSDSEWNTSSGHHVVFRDDVASPTRLNRSPSASLEELYRGSEVRGEGAERLRRSVNPDMDLAEVPLTRFTRKDLMASQYFPVTMTTTSSEEPRRSRSRTRGSQRAQSHSYDYENRSLSREKGSTSDYRIHDNYQGRKRLEKLYLITSEASAVASAPPVIVSPYQQEIARLRLERLRLEEQHLNELARLTTLETVRGPKPKWYELKDTQFHFEAGKNNELLRSTNAWKNALKSRENPLSQSTPDLYSLRTRAACVC